MINDKLIKGKYVGQAEENIRKLFEDAISDQKMFGDESQLHIIVFDELDSICRQRGTINSGKNILNFFLIKIFNFKGTGVHDTMVN